MKLEMRLRPGDDVRALWLLALVLLFAGGFYVRARYQTDISMSFERTEWLYRQTVADSRLVARAAHLRAVERQAETDLAHVAYDTSLSVATANLLVTLHASGHAFDTRVVELQPDGAPGTSDALQATPLTIRVNGTFRNILRFVENLPRHSTLLSVSDTELALASAGARGEAQPHLDATIHATLYRLAHRGTREMDVAADR